jgi:hypothetical protein
MKIPVINNCERLYQIQVSNGLVPEVGKGKRGKVMSTSAATLLTLVPGVNMVDQEVWEKAKENPIVKMRLELEIKPSVAPEAQLEKVGHPMLVEGAPLPDSAPLSALELKECKALIRETFSEQLLNQWMVEEIRPEVRRELDAQIQRMTTGIHEATHSRRVR